MLCVLSFVGYHIGKNILWNRGIGSKFFHYTRFLSIPVFLFSLGYFSVTKTKREMDQADVFNYNCKRQRFIRHSDSAKRIMQARVDYMKTMEDGDTCAV